MSLSNRAFSGSSFQFLSTHPARHKPASFRSSSASASCSEPSALSSQLLALSSAKLQSGPTASAATSWLLTLHLEISCPEHPPQPNPTYHS
mmetsp:Transcript_40961/g.63936  ORF Transcript_40961/g.63936 Transcript_40961/m.63936 type:complete len:91 (-) Transcript_40961:19-291(-)